MIKALPYALATGIIAAGFVSTTAVTEVSAASSYKLVKNKLVHSKTGKAVKNHAIYKKKLYKNGKLVTKTTVYKKFLFKKGKLVTKTTVHNKQLFQKGKLVTKATVYNKQLFHKGKLATGNDLHNKTLYVNGKISSGIVKHNKQFYKAGKKVASNFKFVYKDNVYKGNKVDKNFKIHDNTVYYKDQPFDGILNNNLYVYSNNFGDIVSSNVYHSDNGKSLTVWMNFNQEREMFKYNLKNISINNGAVITSAKTKAGYSGYSVLELKIKKTKMNKNYKLTFNNVSVYGSKPFSFETTISGLTTKMLASKDYKTLKTYYDKYTYEEFNKIPKNSKSYKKIVKDIKDNLNYSSYQNTKHHSALYLAEGTLAQHLLYTLDLNPEF